MKFLDDLIVTVCVGFLRGVLAIRTVIAYIQFIALVLVLVMAGAAAVVMMLVAAKNALFGG